MSRREELIGKVGAVIKWTLVILMALMGVMAFSEKQIFPGLIAVLTVILLSLKKVSMKTKIGGFLIGFTVFGITHTSVNTKRSQPSNTPEQIVKAESQKESFSKEQSSNKSSEVTNTATPNDNESGWKNFKWGMTLEEVLRFKEDLIFTIGGEQLRCNHTNIDLPKESIYFERERSLRYYNNVSELFCTPGDLGGGYLQDTGLLFYKGKLFGKFMELYNYENDNKMQDIIITQLKEKYPDGKTSYMYKIKVGEYRVGEYRVSDKFSYKHETEVGLLDKLLKFEKIPVFEYKSDKITIFINKNFNLYFYDTKVLDELVRKDREHQKKIKDDETVNIKQLF